MLLIAHFKQLIKFYLPLLCLTRLTVKTKAKQMQLYRAKYTSLWIIFSLIVLSSFSHAQYRLSIEADYVSGFNSKAVHIHHAKVEPSISHGYHAAVVQGFGFFKNKFEPTLKAGMKYLYTSSELEDIPFQAGSYKMALAPGVRYRIDSTMRVGLFLGIENNLDFDEFRTKVPDLFRYTIQADFQYMLFRRFGLGLTYETVLSPASDHYLFINPRHQIRVGIIYQIL